MERLTMRMEDGSYQANNDTKFGLENGYSYKNGIIERCGVLEDLLQTEAINMDLVPENLKNKLFK